MIRYYRIGDRRYEVYYYGSGHVGSNFIGHVFNEGNGWCAQPASQSQVWYRARSEQWYPRQYGQRSHGPRYEATCFLMDQVGVPLDRVQRYRERSARPSTTVGLRATPRYSRRFRSPRLRLRNPEPPAVEPTIEPDERYFGVELEFTGPDQSVVYQALVDGGINLSSRNQATMGAIDYQSTDGAAWELKHDGSVNGEGLELVSPKLKGAEGMEQLRRVCEILRSIDARVDSSCGLHVHHDMRGHSVADIKRQVLAFVERQDLIDPLVAPSRRNNSYCMRWDDYHAQTLRDFNRDLREMAYIGPRGNINLQSYARHGSVEVRLHGGSTNYRKIAAWIRFGQTLFAAEMANAPISTDSSEELLRDLVNFDGGNLTTADAAVLLRFLRVGETRREIQQSIAEAQELLVEVSA